MLLVFNPQNFGAYADQMIGHASGCARIALAKDISLWKSDILIIGSAGRHPANQVVNIVLDGLDRNIRVSKIESYNRDQILEILTERSTDSVRIVGSSALGNENEIQDTASFLHDSGIECVIGECLDDRLDLRKQPIAA